MPFSMRAVRHLRGPPSTSLPGPGLGDWPRERRASSPEQPGRSPVGERLGQSQFLCWALDGTDGRRFQPSRAGRVAQGLLPWGTRCQQPHPRGCPHTGCLLHGVSPCRCPAPLTSRPVRPKCRLGSAGTPDSPARAVPSVPLAPGHDLLLLTELRLTASASKIPASQSSPTFGLNCVKKRAEILSRRACPVSL